MILMQIVQKHDLWKLHIQFLSYSSLYVMYNLGHLSLLSLQYLEVWNENSDN